MGQFSFPKISFRNFAENNSISKMWNNRTNDLYKRILHEDKIENKEIKTQNDLIVHKNTEQDKKHSFFKLNC